MGRSGPPAIILTSLIVGAALALRLAGAGDGFALGPGLFPVLFAAAGACTAILLRRASPTGAWLAAVIAAGIAAIEVVGLVRTQQSSADLGHWPVLVAIAESALLTASVIVAAYAVRERGAQSTWWVRAWQASCVLGFVGVALLAVWAIAEVQRAATSGTALSAADIDIWPVRASGRVAAGYIALATIGGVLRDAAPLARRAWARAPSSGAFPRAFVDELLPTSVAMRRRGEEDERARLAADLHARVLPDLRRAAAAAEAGGSGSSEPVSAGLREAIEGVEQLMHSRQSIVLEEYGLVAALEWLAERTEQRSPLEVVVELDGATVDDPGAIPDPIARAAFRVALLAIDNVVRHANASKVLVRLAVDGAAINLAIADNGTGFDGDAAPRGGRGLMDMRAAAAAVGGAVTVEASAAGTRITFRRALT